MRLLVTGGAGFIGSHFIGSFLSENPDAEAVNVDSLTYASIFKPDFERQFGRRYSFLRADIIDSEKMAAACRDADLVINFAAETHVDNSIATRCASQGQTSLALPPS